MVRASVRIATAIVAVTTGVAAAFVTTTPFLHRYHNDGGATTSNKLRHSDLCAVAGRQQNVPHHESIPKSTEVSSAMETEEVHSFIAADFENSQTVSSFSPAESVVEPQCVDIVRDLSGNPLTVEYFAEKLNIPHALSYSCPESDAFRGLMSNACRIHLWPGGETAFYKRIVFQDHQHALKKLKTAPYKLNSDIQSYKVVTFFLSSKACQAVRETAGVGIPICYDTQLEPNDDNPIESKFSFILEDFKPSDGWYQQWLLKDIDECKASLSTLAKLHAFFWNGSSFWKKNENNAATELEAGVWQSASYVQPKRNLHQCENVAKGWATSRMNCEQELSSFDFWDDLGERLQTMAEENGRLAHPFATGNGTTTTPALSESYKKYRTFCHGDPKQANFLFRRPTSTESGKGLQVGLIDFQWCGFGLAATDMAHFFTSAVHADLLVDGGERELLRYYFDQLQEHLVEYGAYENANDAIQNFSYDTFMTQYETGVLDICRLVIAYAWSRFDPVEEDDEAGLARTMNQNSYNKSKPNVVWLTSRCDEIMKSRGY